MFQFLNVFHVSKFHILSIFTPINFHYNSTIKFEICRNIPFRFERSSFFWRKEMLDTGFVRSGSTSSIVTLSSSARRSSRRVLRPASHESVLFEAADAFDSVLSQGVVSHSRLSDDSQPSSHHKRRSRKLDLFASASTFDSIVKSIPAPLRLEPMSASPFQKYLKRDSRHESITIDEAKSILLERMHTVNLESVNFFERVSASKVDLCCISREIKGCHSLSADQLRHYFRFQIAVHTHRIDFFEAEYAAMKANVRQFAQFRDFLDRNPSPDLGVDFRTFCADLRQVPSDPARFEAEEALLKSQVQRALRLPRPPPDPYASFADPETRTGQILRRLRREVPRVLFPDLDTIAAALLEALRERCLFGRAALVDELFDIGWTVMPYPFAPAVQAFRIPPTSDVVAKVFAPDFIGDEWLFVPLGKLAGRDWPLRSATERLFPIVALTSPFAIADHFYGVIDEIGKCVQRIIIRSGRKAQFVEIDFDQMFVLMILCILASGLYDILAPMQYAYAFADFVKTDPCRQYAMSHMEGLCTHLAQIDYTDLRKRSALLIERFTSERDADPLAATLQL
jgi:hypothetical protein